MEGGVEVRDVLPLTRRSGGTPAPALLHLMTPEPKHEPVRLKRLEREVGERERKLKPEQRRDYVRHLLACQLNNVVVTAETRLEWLTQLEVR